MTTSAVTTEREEALSRFVVAFKHLSGAVRRQRGRDGHRSGELTYAQAGLLFGLAENGEQSASELAQYADVAPATATEMLDGLESAGLIERRRSEQDRRIVLVSLTARGTELITERRASYQAHWEEALSEFSPNELLTAANVLDRIRAMFDGLAATAEPSGD
jgi:DNA-binding MarR family transcriptional regulator